jgi:hypothetical protein
VSERLFESGDGGDVDAGLGAGAPLAVRMRPRRL